MVKIIYDDLLGVYFDEEGNEVKGIPVVNIKDNGKSFGKYFEYEKLITEEQKNENS